jgi:glycosyltransferase involved in cell wall biosynthesis
MDVAIARPTVSRARSAFEGELTCYEHIDRRHEVNIDLIARANTDLETSLNIIEIPQSTVEQLKHIGREAMTRLRDSDRMIMREFSAQYDVLRERDYDVIETSDPTLYPESFTAYRAARDTGAAFVPTVSSTKSLAGIVPEDQTATMFEAADAMLFISPQVHDRLVAEGYLKADDKRPVYRGHPINTEQFECGDPVGQNLLSVGMIEERKGFKHIARAVARVAEGHELTWHIVGEGPLLEWIVEFSEQHGFSEMVEIHGSVDHDRIPELYGMSDVFVLHSLETPTWEEYFGVVYAEAMSSCLPVIGSESGVIPWVVRDGIDGILVSEGDVEDIADAIDRVLDDESLRHEMGRNGRKNVEDRFAMEAVADTFVDTWRTAAQRVVE